MNETIEDSERPPPDEGGGSVSWALEADVDVETERP